MIRRSKEGEKVYTAARHGPFSGPKEKRTPVRKVRAGIDGVNGTLLDISEKLDKIIELLEQRR